MLLRTETREPPVQVIAGIPMPTWRLIMLVIRSLPRALMRRLTF